MAPTKHNNQQEWQQNTLAQLVDEVDEVMDGQTGEEFNTGESGDNSTCRIFLHRDLSASFQLGHGKKPMKHHSPVVVVSFVHSQ
jgi:hypothetical protein